MTNDHDNNEENVNSIIVEEEKDDLETYLEEMKTLESDFSDLEDLDFEELKAMQDAIKRVQDGDIPQIIEDTESGSTALETTPNDQQKYISEKESLLTDFSDLDDISFEELEDMKEAIESVKQVEIQKEESSSPVDSTTISTDLEERIKQELEERKEEEEEEIITPEKLIEYALNKRDKIWYHALYYLVFQAEDHVASKQLLYDMLKEVTSKSPIDPIPEHQFYFGLGYILRLSLNDKQIIRYLRGSKFKINIGVQILKDVLNEVGEPISTRPVLKEEEKKKMFKDFLADDFLDI